MSRLLASVRSESEAIQVLRCGADIIDCKEPDDGALGALPAETIRRIVKAVAGRRPVSATTGNICTNSRKLHERIEATADCGVDYVKIGMFSHPFLAEQLRSFSALAKKHSLIAVCFADLTYPDDLLPRLADCGILGVMIDTANKSSASLTELWSNQQIGSLVRRARELRLLSGVAGRVMLSDIPKLLEHDADYIGLRSALCGGNRRLEIDMVATMQVRQAIPAHREAIGTQVAGSALQ